MNRIRHASVLLLLGLAAAVSAQTTVWRIEADYSQPRLHQGSQNQLYYHGGRLGVSFDYNFDRLSVFGIRTGLFYGLTYASDVQNYPLLNDQVAAAEYVEHWHLMHNLYLPLMPQLHFSLPAKMQLFVFAGPTAVFGLYHQTHSDVYLTEATQQVIHQTYGYLLQDGNRNLYGGSEADALRRVGLQLGLGGGWQWKQWRIQGGYDWGLTNHGKGNYTKHLSNWYVGVGYEFSR